MGILDRLAQEQEAADNRDVAQAAHDADWAQTFSSIPKSEVLRSRVNLADTIDRAFANKLALQARSDEKALGLLQKKAEYDEWMAQAPLREQLLSARVKATGATERRKAEEAVAEAEHTAGFNLGLMRARKQFGEGTPEFQDAAIELYSTFPRAELQQTDELAAALGFEDTAAAKKAAAVTRARKLAEAEFAKTPAQIEAEAAARARGTASVKPAAKTVEDIEAEAAARARGTASVKPEKVPGVPSGVSTQYAAALGKISELKAAEDATKDANKKAKFAAERIGAEEIVRSLESQHAGLRATRGLPAEKPITTADMRAAAAALATAAAEEAAPALAAAAAATPVFTPGMERVKNGIVYVRGEDGIWLPKR